MVTQAAVGFRALGVGGASRLKGVERGGVNLASCSGSWGWAMGPVWSGSWGWAMGPVWLPSDFGEAPLIVKAPGEPDP